MNVGMPTATDNPYLREAVLTATPEQLQLMLYDGAIRFTRQAKEAVVRNDLAESCERLCRAQNIVTEMLNALNYEVNSELCERVASIYHFIHRKLVEANSTRNPQAFDDALRVLEIERETWRILVEKVGRERENDPTGTTPPPVNLPSDPSTGLCVEG